MAIPSAYVLKDLNNVSFFKFAALPCDLEVTELSLSVGERYFFICFLFSGFVGLGG